MGNELFVDRRKLAILGIRNRQGASDGARPAPVRTKNNDHPFATGLIHVFV